MSEIQTLNESKSNTIIATQRSLFENYINKNPDIINKTKYNRATINQSWDFTPFPKFLFPNEKRHALNSINKLNFPGVKDRFNSNKSYKNKKFKIFIEEIKGDITKQRAPAYTFCSPRDDVKLPFRDFPEPITPSPGSYNLRPLEGFNYFSPKYSFPKKTTNKYKYSLTEINPGPGPGHYHHNKCDLSNQGNYHLSTFNNAPASTFGKYKEARDNDNLFSEFNVKPSPASYDTNNKLTMFSGNGKYALSTFSSKNGKTIPNTKFFYQSDKLGYAPGPGTYNHHSIFIGGRYSK